MNAIELGIFANRIAAICDEMGAVLQRTAFSPNIRDRLDYSCALFDSEGNLIAQAAHIPVHLGSMAYAMADIVMARGWEEGEMVIMNDPFKGGTHLPDVTLIAPLYIDTLLQGFVVNRAHHANIGCSKPGSMPVSTDIHQEGIVISPVALLQQGVMDYDLLQSLLDQIDNVHFNGDIQAQVSANRIGISRLQRLMGEFGTGPYHEGITALNHHSETMVRALISTFPDGCYHFTDVMESDGSGDTDFRLKVQVTISADEIEFDFNGTTDQVKGNINAPKGVTAAGVYYLLRTLMPEDIPTCAGTFRPISLKIPEGSLLNPQYPAAVVAGNVETSSRVVDLVAGALAQALPEKIPAASQGTMNNVAMGSNGEGRAWDYYETIGGGMGAGPSHHGLSGVQCHMTNTLNTPIEILEKSYPLRVTRYQRRADSGGEGWHRGGDGIVREYQFLQPATVTLITERRLRSPWGLQGGENGACGENRLNGELLDAKISIEVKPEDRLTIATPGGGGWGER